MFKIFLLCLLAKALLSSTENPKCGVSNSDGVNGLIVGGKVAEIKEVPWQVSIQQNHGQGFYHECGGVILNKQWIVTAAHCFDYYYNEMRIVAGAQRILEWTQGMSLHSIESVVIHPEYRRSTMKSDIALVKLANPIDFAASDGHSSAICLPDPGYYPRGKATVSGWGSTHEYNNDNSNDLLVVEVPLVTQKYCKSKFGANKIDNTVLCAGSIEGQDSCSGDSGGPLFQNVENQNVLIGIVSYGHGCGRKDWPGVYTDVGKYLDWIYKYINS